MTALLLGVALYGVAILLLGRFLSINRRDEEFEEQRLLEQLRSASQAAPLTQKVVRVETAD